MVKNILLYFLLAFCLLSKDGITLIIDSIQVKQSVVAVLEKTLDNTAEEEDVTEDLWHCTSTDIEDFFLLSVEFTSQKTPNSSEENLLQVHLERIIPPPEKAWD